MAGRKVFVKTDLSVPEIEQEEFVDGARIPVSLIPPASTVVKFGREVSGKRNFEFAPWYGVGIDQVTYAYQRQIERFLAKQDTELSGMTVASYCYNGAGFFLDYLVLRSTALQRQFSLSDIDRDLMDGFVSSSDGETCSQSTKSGRYHGVKAVLKALSARGLINEIHGGDSATFPLNPYPGKDKAHKSAKPLSTSERKAFTAALRKAIAPLLEQNVEVTADLLAYALLVIALHTGRNTTPLLEMSMDCLRAHPKSDTQFLVLFKRRGHSTNKVALRSSKQSEAIESIPTLRPTVAQLVSKLIQLAQPLQNVAPKEFRGRVFLYRMQRAGRGVGAIGAVTALSDATLRVAILKLVADFDLKDNDGRPLVVNVGRLRKTFVNRLYEILDGDLVATAAAAGNTIRITAAHYLLPGENAQSNWRFLGLALTQELLTSTLGATERTPAGRCSDVHSGEYAPKNKAEICMSFLNCIRCRNYVVTADDLYRLFSFYWRLLYERARMNAKRWNKHLAHIVRLIDRDVVDAGVRRGVFKQDQVDRERERARVTPHPFWRSESIIANLSSVAAS